VGKKIDGEKGRKGEREKETRRTQDAGHMTQDAGKIPGVPLPGGVRGGLKKALGGRRWKMVEEVEEFEEETEGHTTK